MSFAAKVLFVAETLVLLVLLYALFLVWILSKETDAELLNLEQENEFLRNQNHELKRQCQKLETRLTLIGKS